jgi:hypothetical protein
MTRQWIGVGAGMLAGLVLAGVIAAAPTKVAAPVEVVNFPAVQGVDGVVNVGNFPAVQGVEVHGQVPVEGQVDVRNLPVDADGNLRVASTRLVTVHFAGYTTATFAEGAGLLALNRACQMEFPGTRVCRGSELVDMVPAPPVIVPNQGGDPSQPGYAFLVSFGQQVVSLGSQENGASIPFSSCMSALGRPFDCGALPMPIGCCEP